MKGNNNIFEVRNVIRTEPVGCCIYCGTTHELTDEHVIPLALAGNIILTNSSCHKCASITSDFERKVLRGFMLNARVAGKYPTRKPKKRPKTLPLQIGNNGEFKYVELSPEEHPALLFMPLFETPSIFTGKSLKKGVTIYGFETLYFGKNPEDVAKDLGIKTIQTTENLDIISFVRLLAKIGYSYSVATLGLLPRERVLVLPLILGTADDASSWLGSSNFKLAIEEKGPIHALAYEWTPHPNDDTKELLVVRVKLFAQSGTTGYEIIICWRNRQAM